MRNLIELSVLVSAAALVVAAVPLAAMAHQGVDHKHAPADALAVTARVRTGTGADTYETVPNWCQIPGNGKTLGPTHGAIVVDKKGQIYFSMDGGPHGILVYSPDGKFQRGIADKLTGIHGMAIREEDGQEYIYAAHLAGKQAVKLKTDGTVVWTLGFDKVNESGKYKDAKQYLPTAIAVGPNGDVYVADGYGQNWIHRFDKNQKYVRSFGGPGAEPGKFKTCHGLGLDSRGDKPLLLVCDRENRRLQHFDLDGKFVAVITEDLRRPCSVSFHGDKVVIAELAGRVAIIDGTNKVVSVLGDNPDEAQRANYGVPPDQWKDGIFTAPHGVSYDWDGNVYVMDWNASGRVSKLTRVAQQARTE
jgi:DNA-binding beta-propeller fold protein YncE